MPLSIPLCSQIYLQDVFPWTGAGRRVPVWFALFLPRGTNLWWSPCTEQNAAVPGDQAHVTVPKCTSSFLNPFTSLSTSSQICLRRDFWCRGELPAFIAMGIQTGHSPGLPLPEQWGWKRWCPEPPQPHGSCKGTGQNPSPAPEFGAEAQHAPPTHKIEIEKEERKEKPAANRVRIQPEKPRQYQQHATNGQNYQEQGDDSHIGHFLSDKGLKLGSALGAGHLCYKENQQEQQKSPESHPNRWLDGIILCLACIMLPCFSPLLLHLISIPNCTVHLWKKIKFEWSGQNFKAHSPATTLRAHDGGTGLYS